MRYLGLVALLATNVGLIQNASAAIEGRVFDGETQFGLEGAVISIDDDPDTSGVFATTQADAFGFYRFENIPAGNYVFEANHPAYDSLIINDFSVGSNEITQNAVLTALDDGTPWFDVYIQLNSVVSGLEAEGIPVRCVFDPEGAPSAITIAAVTDENGCAAFRGFTNGEFQFFFNDAAAASATGVEVSPFFVEYISEKKSLSGPHTVSLLLEPAKDTLQFFVDWDFYVGSFNFNDPQIAKNFTIKITGVDPRDPTRELLPTRSGLTDENGEAFFNNLPKLAWRVEVSRIGFEMVENEVIIFPEANGDLPDATQTIQMRNDEDLWARIGHDLEVPYYAGFTRNSFGSVPAPQARLYPHKGSNSAGLYDNPEFAYFYTLNPLEGEGALRATNGFIDFPPGRFDLVVDNFQILEFANDGDISNGVDADFRIRMTYRETFENIPGIGAQITGTVDVIPATVSGRLLVKDQITGGELSEAGRRPRANERVIFEVHEMAKAKVKPESHQIETTTDANGEFSLELPPSIYGIVLPDMQDGYWGEGIFIGGTDPFNPGPSGKGRSGWPLKDIYEPTTPRSSWSNYIAPDGLTLNSGARFEIDLLVAEEVYGIDGQVNIGNDPNFAALIVREDGFSDVGLRFMDYVDVQSATVQLGNGQSTPLRANGEAYFYTVDNIPPGTYDPELSAARYASTTDPAGPFILPDLPGPGLPPGNADFNFDNIFYFPGDTVSGTASRIEGESTLTTEALEATVRIWDENLNDGEGGYAESSTLARYYRVDYAGETPFAGSPIAGRWSKAWFIAGNDTFAFDPGETLEITIGGPAPNTPTTFLPGVNYSVSVEAENIAFRGQPVAASVSINVGPTQLTPASRQGLTDSFPSIDLVDTTWFLVNDSFDPSSARLINRGTPTQPVFEEKMLLSRDLTVSFNITGLVNGQTEIFRDFDFTLVSPTGEIVGDSGDLDQITQSGSFVNYELEILYAPYFIEVKQRGFKPMRMEIPYTSATSIGSNDFELDLGDIVLTPLDEPAIDGEVVFDKRGFFFAGLKNAGDISLFDDSETKEALQLNWQATVNGVSETLNWPAAYDDNASKTGPTSRTLEDPIAELWLIDRRIWSNDSWSLGGFATFELPTGNYARLQWLEDLLKVDENTASPGEPAGADLNRRTVWFQQLTGSKLTGSDLARSADASFQLSDLPPGYFRPALIAVTKNGGVLVHLPPQEDPMNDGALFGIRLPDSFSTLLDTVALIASGQSTAEKLKAVLPDGRFIALPDFNAEITAEGDDAPKHVNYSYEFGVNWSEGLGIPGAGILSLAPGFLGGTFESDGSFTLDGDSGGVGMEIGTSYVINNLTEGNVGLKGEGRFDPRRYFPPLLQKLGVNYSIGEVIVDARTSQTDTLSNSEIELQHRVSFQINDIELRMDLEPVTGKIPYVGPVLTGLSATNALVIEGVVDAAVGLNASRTWTTENPARSAILEPDFPVDETPGSAEYVIVQLDDPLPTTPRNHFLGGAEYDRGPTDEFDLTFQFGVGMDITVAGGRAGAKARFNLTGLDGESDDPRENSVRVVPNLSGDWPPVERITGRMTGTLEAFADVVFTTLEKSWEWELIRFDHQFTTDSLIEFIPMTIIQSSTAKETVEYNGVAPEILSDLNAQTKVVIPESNSQFAIYTEAADGGGTSVKLIDRLDETTFAPAGPIEIATGTNVIDLDVIEHWTGEWIVVWSEVADADLNLTITPSRIRAVVGNASLSNWSAPETVAELPRIAREVAAGRASGTFSYVAWVLELDGFDDPLADLGSARYENGVWQAPQTNEIGRDVLAFDVPRGTEVSDPAGIYFIDPSALRHTTEGVDSSNFTVFGTQAPFDIKRRLSTNTHPYVLAVSDKPGGVLFAITNPDSNSTLVSGTLFEESVPEAIAIEPVASDVDLFFVAWSETTEIGEHNLRYMLLDRSIAPFVAVDSGVIVADSPVSFTELELANSGDTTVTLYARTSGDDRRGALRQFRLDAALGLIDNDLDDDDLPDAEELRIIDAIPDDEIKLIGDVLGADDFDGDGVNNAVEIANGTDPTDRNDPSDAIITGVGVVALDGVASEQGLSSALLQFQRNTEDLSAALTIDFAVTGTASESTDFSPIARSVTIPANAATVTLELFPLADDELEGPETIIVTLAESDDYDIITSRSSATLTLDDLPLNNFRVEAYGPIDGANDAISGLLTDSELDGLPVLLEYAFALDPTVAEGNGDPKIIIFEDEFGELYVGIEYRESRNAPDVTYTVEVNHDFDSPWRSGSEHVEIVEREPGVEFDLIVARALAPVGVDSGDAAFIRVRVGTE